ncbi:LPD7 domain-containing protein [Citrobacter braakii]|uniref:LPD7 domain-containing protein n=1 Tax=Citrobacter braakii TaxID=57706 RepID=UPI0040398531
MLEKRTYLTITPESRPAALRAAGKMDNGENSLEYDRSLKLWFAKENANLDKVKQWLPENTVSGNYQTETNLTPQEEFSKVLKEAGFVFPAGELPIMDSKRHRCLVEGDKAKTNRAGSGTYQGYLDGRPAGWYENFRSSTGKVNWKSTGEFQLDPALAMQQRALNAQNQWDRKREQEQIFDNTAAQLTRQMERMPLAPATHPYLVRKQVPAVEGVRQDKYSNLVIPLHNLKNEIRTVEYIAPDGTKNLKKGGEKSGNFFVVGGALQNSPHSPVLYAEGYATAASLYLATGYPVVMTVDAGNLVTVSQALKQAYPDSPHLIFGEDDFTKKDNKGLNKAREAAQLIGAEYVIPTFLDDERAQAFAGTASFSDFNDIHVSRGLDAVLEQVAPALIAAGIETNTMKTEMIPDEPDTPVSDDYDAYLDSLALASQAVISEPGPDIVAGDSVATELQLPAEPGVTAATGVDDTAAADQQSPAEPEVTAATGVDDTVAADQQSPAEPEVKAATGADDTVAADLQSPAEPEVTAGTGADDTVAADLQSPAEPEVTAATGVDDTAAADQQSPAEPEVTAATGVDDTAAADQQSPAEPEVTAATGVDDTVAADQQSPAEPEVTTATGVDDTAATDQQSPAEPEVTAATGVDDTVAADQPPPAEPETTATAESGTKHTVEENGFAFAFGGNRESLDPEPVPIDLDKLLQGLKRRMEGNTWVYSLDDNVAFIHSINHGQFVMATPEASKDDRMVLAALLAAKEDATAFKRGGIEITGSDEFKQKVLQLIIENDIDVRLLNPDQRDALNKMRAEVAAPQDRLQAGASTRPDPIEPSATPEASVLQETRHHATDEHAVSAPVSDAGKQANSSAVPSEREQKQPDSNNTPSTGAKSEWANTVTGVLLDHGNAPYKFDKKNNDSYYLKVMTQKGEKTYWGKELEQAIADGGAEKGEPINLRYLGSQPVSFNAPVRNEQGAITGYKEVSAERNQWEVKPAVERSTLIARDEQSAVPSTLSVYDANQFWQLQQSVVQSAGLSLATQPGTGHELLWMQSDGKGVSAPGTPPDNVTVPEISKAAGSVVMQAFDSDKNVLMHLVKAHGDYLQGVVRQGNEYQHVIGKLCDSPEGHRYIALNSVGQDGKLNQVGYGNAINQVRKGGEVNFDSFVFKLSGAEKIIATLNKPANFPAAWHEKLGFTQRYTPPKTDPQPQAKPVHQQQQTMQPG